MAAGDQHFNQAAATWDVKPERARLSEAVAEYIRDRIRPERNTTKILDFGCGTGQVSLLLRNYALRITAVDSAQGMLTELEKKLAAGGVCNIKVRCLDILHEAHLLERGGYDLIISQMALHHIQDVQKVLVQLKKLLTPYGKICLTDLDREDGTFHNRDVFIPHNGFDRTEFAAMLHEVGFFDITFCTPFTVTKPGNDGQLRDYPLFMAIAANMAAAAGGRC